MTESTYLSNIVPAASRSGKMFTDQMLRYIRLVLASRVDRFRQAYVTYTKITNRIF